MRNPRDYLTRLRWLRLRSGTVMTLLLVNTLTRDTHLHGQP